MKRIKRLLTLVLSMAMVLGIVGVSYAENSGETLKEKLLNHYSEDIESKIDLITKMEIILGSDKGLELERALTRAEGATVYIKLFEFTKNATKLQKENAEYKTHFNDLPEWAKIYVNYLYKEGLIFGVSDNKFGSNQEMTVEQFVTMILRGLGYSDKTGDFVWNKSLDMAVDIGLISSEEKDNIEKDKVFNREEMILIAYNALFTENKLTKDLLLQERQISGVKNITQIMYIELTQEELEEIDKTENDKKYVVFNNNPEKQKSLYSKVKELQQANIDLMSITLDGKKVEYKLRDIQSITISEWGGIMVIYNDAFMSLLSIKDNILINEDDKWLLQDVFMQLVCEDTESPWIKMDRRDNDDDIFSADILDNKTEKYLFSAITKTTDYKELKFEIETYIK